MNGLSFRVIMQGSRLGLEFVTSGGVHAKASPLNSHRII
jgi:hypothetical protein